MAANTEALNKAWKTIVDFLSPGGRPILEVSFPEIQFQSAVDILVQNGIVNIIEDWFFENVQRDIRQRVAPNFWNYYTSTACQGASEWSDNLLKAVQFLHQVSEEYKPSLQRLESISSGTHPKNSLQTFCGVQKLSDVLITLFKAIIFAQVPNGYQEGLDHFYSEAFKVFNDTNSDNKGGGNEEVERQCDGCGENTEVCRCAQIMDRFHTVNRLLDEVGILEEVSGTSATALVHEKIQQHVEAQCKGRFETSFLESLENWLDTKVLGWLNLIYTGNRTHIGADCISSFRGRLQHFLYKTYAQVQINEFFKIIIDFPESAPAVQDLKACLEKTDMRAQLISTLRSSIETRLLHPGVNTSDILTAYISAIRALRVLDPAGVILELVCDPVRKYLRCRDDTVRCIVSSLTDDGSSELLDELIKGQPLVLDESGHSDDEDEDWEKWNPDPVDADPATASKSRRASDIISMLVNIYGSKELFVNEYRTLLADRILTNFNYEIGREIRYLEHLKLRFGESQLHYCEVMLKDVADSKRINARIKEEKAQRNEQDVVEVNSMILSAQFWPAFREEKITLPEEMQKLLEAYTKKFEALKGNRTLQWKSHLGLMNIDIELKDRTINFKVSPVHAAIIMQFQEKNKWTVEELSKTLQMPATALRRKIAYWQSQGLLKEESNDTFVLVEDHRGHTHDYLMTEDDETESAMASTQAQKEEEYQIYWSYIVGMLTNLESLPIERIHSMLRMFTMQGASTMECTIQELKQFLDRKVKEQQLMYSGGVYRLPK
ncbi:hypothetical protein ACJMK2_041966 [Sinanodonta woodiana]|uniref:Anaphase-promoting complex subunit 2 n=1 Tax=Sinanodonta woodiana TaxID=1069815 RepID=A0ABD3W5V9_SINWO